MKNKYSDFGRCLVCVENSCQCKVEECCVCGEKADFHCGSCKIAYCGKHYGTTVMTGNCCSGNEKDYNS